MKPIAFVTDDQSLPIDYDMVPLRNACNALNLPTEICRWDDPNVVWEGYEMVLLRSPWTYADRLEDFRTWCRRVDQLTRLENPLDVIEWGLDKHYLADLSIQGVPIVPTRFVEPSDADANASLTEFLEQHPQAREVVVKPSVGAYSRNVQRFPRDRIADAVTHIEALHRTGCAAIVQPYFDSIDRLGETDLIFFNGEFSHAIRKGALLMEDGTVNVPTSEFRKQRTPGEDEIMVAKSALSAVSCVFDLPVALLYARIDLIRDNDGNPVVLELEISEPSLSLPFCEGSAERFSKALASVIRQGTDAEGVSA